MSGVGGSPGQFAGSFSKALIMMDTESPTLPSMAPRSHAAQHFSQPQREDTWLVCIFSVYLQLLPNSDSFPCSMPKIKASPACWVSVCRNVLLLLLHTSLLLVLCFSSNSSFSVCSGLRSALLRILTLASNFSHHSNCIFCTLQEQLLLFHQDAPFSLSLAVRRPQVCFSSLVSACLRRWTAPNFLGIPSIQACPSPARGVILQPVSAVRA